jgi:Flp pilus assembly pilin Flp
MTIDRTRQAMSETGQTMAEYAVVLALIVVVTLATFTALGNQVESAFTLVRSALP